MMKYETCTGNTFNAFLPFQKKIIPFLKYIEFLNPINEMTGMVRENDDQMSKEIYVQWSMP